MFGHKKSAVPVVADKTADQALVFTKGASEPEPVQVIVVNVRKSLPTAKEADIKAALWRLYYRGLVEVTPDWKVKYR